MTRQEKFLEQYPGALVMDGELRIKPCQIDFSLYNTEKCMKSFCEDCRKEYWLEEK